MFPSSNQPQHPDSNREAWQQIRNMQQARQRLKETWVHWDYSPQEWAQLDRIDVRLGQRVATFLLIALPFWVFFGLILYFNVGPLGAALAVAITHLFVFGVGWLNYFLSEDRHRHEARCKPGQPHRVTLTGEGIWLAGTHFPLSDTLATLEQVTMTPAPPVLHFRREVHEKYTPVDTTGRTIHLLVPRGHEWEAAQLVQRYQVEVIEAKREARQRVQRPPEPR